jgi:hypothetical protein
MTYTWQPYTCFLSGIGLKGNEIYQVYVEQIFWQSLFTWNLSHCHIMMTNNYTWYIQKSWMEYPKIMFGKLLVEYSENLSGISTGAVLWSWRQLPWPFNNACHPARAKSHWTEDVLQRFEAERKTLLQRDGQPRDRCKEKVCWHRD